MTDITCARCGALTENGRCLHCESVTGGAYGPAAIAASRGKSAPGLITILRLFLLAVFVASFLYRGFKLRHNSSSLARSGPVANRSELIGDGPIYLVQIGSHTAAYSLEDLAAWLHSKYGLEVHVLPPMAVDKSAEKPARSRSQLVAELLYEQIKREHPDIASSQNSYLIGFTDASMYSVYNHWSSTFTQRDQQRAAIISSDGMSDNLGDFLFLRGSSREHLQSRLRRILLKDIAILYWHLPQNNDPTSVLHATLDPDVPTEDLFESDLDPARTQWGESAHEPAIFFTYSAKNGVRFLPGPLIRDRLYLKTPVPDESEELFEFDVRLGLGTIHHTDVYLPDSIPIQFQRSLRDGWPTAQAFGFSGSDYYDEFLSSADNITIRRFAGDGSRDSMIREPLHETNLLKVKYIDTTYSGHYSEMRWAPAPFEHYDLRLWDGSVKTYLPCNNTVRCLLVGYRDSNGHLLQIQRDAMRRLVRLESPGGSWLRLSYGPEGSISEAEDSRGRKIRYLYNRQNELIEVDYPSGESIHYEYDGLHHILSVAVSSDKHSAPHVLFRNQYWNGLLSQQTFENGEMFLYEYEAGVPAPIHSVTVRAPGDKSYVVTAGDEISNIREITRR